jgi:hypothetical protein
MIRRRDVIKLGAGVVATTDTYGGEGDPTEADYPTLTDEEIAAKFDRACGIMKIENAQRDRARAAWTNRRPMKDIREAIQTLATFGKPLPL